MEEIEWEFTRITRTRTRTTITLLDKSNKGSNNNSEGVGGMLSFKQGLSEAASPGIYKAQLQVWDYRSSANSYCPIPLFASCQHLALQVCLGSRDPVLLPGETGKNGH